MPCDVLALLREQNTWAPRPNGTYGTHGTYATNPSVL